MDYKSSIRGSYLIRNRSDYYSVNPVTSFVIFGEPNTLKSPAEMWGFFINLNILLLLASHNSLILCSMIA